MTDALKDLFARAAADDSPGRVDLHRVIQSGRRREHARRSAVVAGVGVVAATISSIGVQSHRKQGVGSAVRPAAAGTSGAASTPDETSAPPAVESASAPASVASPSTPTPDAASSPPDLAGASTDPSCQDANAGTPPKGNTAPIPGSADVAAAVRAAAPGVTFKVVESGPIMELSKIGYETLELMGEVSDAQGPSGIQVQAAAEGVTAATAAAAQVHSAACSGRSYRRSALAYGGVLLTETTRPVDKNGYEVIAWTGKGVRVRASAEPFVCCVKTGPSKGAPYGDRTTPLLTVDQLEKVVLALANA
ncbi:MAG: hypothetical protein ABI912_01190 [Actinomycetota bacterium]